MAPTLDRDAEGALTLWERTPLDERPDLLVHLHEQQLVEDLRALAVAYYGTAYGLWRDDPAGFIQTVLGESLTDVQVRIAEAVRDLPRVVIPACFASGKTHLLARLVVWFALVHPVGTATAVTTASRMRQVITQIWPHIRRVVVDHGLPGDPQTSQWMVPRPDGQLVERVAYGFTPPAHDPEAVQGVHSPHVLVGVDEGGIIPETTGRAWQSATTGLHTRLVVLGNPPIDAEDSWLEKITLSAEWHAIRIRARDTPNFSGEPAPRCRTCVDWVQREHPVSDHLIQQEDVAGWIREYGADDPFVRSKAEAEFTSGAANKVVPRIWVERARIRRPVDGSDDPVAEARGPLPRRDPKLPVLPFIRLGVDIAMGGADELAIARREGMLARIVHTQRGDANANAVTVASVIAEHIKEAQELRAALGMTGPQFPLDVVLDVTGGGWGVGSTLDAWNSEGTLGNDVVLILVNFGESAEDPALYENRKAELWWGLRKALQPDGVEPAPLTLDVDERTAAQIGDPKRESTSGGKFRVEPKDKLAARGRPSPDRAEAVALASYFPPSLRPRTRRGIIAG